MKGFAMLALIPARAGSKGIKNKNLALLNNKPLLYYTIEAAKQASCVDEIVVSSDGDSILEYAKSCGAKILKRPENLASDTATSAEVVLHTLEHFRDCNELILLQPTSPLRDSGDITEAYQIFKHNQANALLSVTECDNKILKAFVTDENNTLQGICNNHYPFMPRQSLPKTYQSNGAIYIIKRDLFIKQPSFLPPKTHYYVMSEMKSIDIDKQEDLDQAERILKILKN